MSENIPPYGSVDRHSITVKILDVDTTEQFIMNQDALPEAMRDWRNYRIEYGGCNEECLWEGNIMLPPEADPTLLVQFLMGTIAYHQIWKSFSATDCKHEWDKSEQITTCKKCGQEGNVN